MATWRLKSAEFRESSSSDPIESLSSVPLPLIHVLRARGVRSATEAWDWLSPSLKNLRDPLSLHCMDRSVARIIEAFEKKEPICIYADFDLDGTSGLALLKTGLKQLGFDQLSHYQPKRLSEGYGLHAEAVRAIAQAGARVIISVDVGITAVAAAQAAREHQVDLIITDHHLPSAELPQAFAIVNPNLPYCSSGLGHLSGAGVAFYLLLAVARALREKNLVNQSFDPKSVLDFFVIGTLTDLVPLVGENRSLCKHGLLQMEKTQRPGLRALLEALELGGRPLSSADIAIKLAPKLNALSRMEGELLPIDVLLESDDGRARLLVERVLNTNRERRERQAMAEDEAVQKAQSQIASGFVWLYSPDYHKGIVGLVATKIAKQFLVPAFVGSLNAECVITGSARAPDAWAGNLVDILAQAKSSLMRFGGHAKAAGFELMVDKQDEFFQGLGVACAKFARPQIPTLDYDVEITLSDLSEEFLRWLESLEPFGVGFEAPLFRLSGAAVKSVKQLRGGHLRLEIIDARASRWTQARTALWFSPPTGASELLEKLSAGGAIDLLVQGSWNYFRGQKSFQLQVHDLRLAGEERP